MTSRHLCLGALILLLIVVPAQFAAAQHGGWSFGGGGYGGMRSYGGHQYRQNYGHNNYNYGGHGYRQPAQQYSAPKSPAQAFPDSLRKKGAVGFTHSDCRTWSRKQPVSQLAASLQQGDGNQRRFEMKTIKSESASSSSEDCGCDGAAGMPGESDAMRTQPGETDSAYAMPAAAASSTAY